MRNSIKRLLNLALAMLLVVSCLPVQAFAAEGEVLARNEDTEAVYSNVTEALAEASAGETIVLSANAEEMFVQVPADITLDLNGNTLAASYVASFGDIIDSSADSTGLLAVDSERVMLSAENSELPVKCGNGYRFVGIKQFNEAASEKEGKYYFQPLFEEGALEILKENSKEGGVSVCVYVAWEKDGNICTQEFVFNNNLFEQYINSYNPETGKYGKMFTLTLKNCTINDIEFISAVASEIGVMFTPYNFIIDEEEPENPVISTESEVTTNEENKISEEVSLSGNGVLAEIEEGAQLEEGATSVTLSVAPMETTESNIVLEEDETMTSYDIHIEGLSADNTVPVKVTLFRFLEKGLNSSGISLYHVENGVTVPMTLVDDPKNHNEFSYDPSTGTVVICAATFSEYDVVTDDKNLWDSNNFDTDWYTKNVNANTFTISNAEQLAGFGKLVDDGNTFEGKTILLGADINLGGGHFNPIGCGYVDSSINSNGVTGAPFMGTFDGQGHTISNFTQNGWEIGLSYCNLGGGLFASIANGTVKNLTIVGANVTMECVEMGALVGLSQGSCTYKNINIYDSNIANYQRATGGLIGEISSLKGNKENITTIENVVIGYDVIVGSLWGDFDAPVGGVIGALWNNNNTDNNVIMNNVTVACQLDVYNDVTSSYQWYAYRRAGMLIGNTETSAANENGTNIASAPTLTCDNVTVKYGNWVNYHYCEFNNYNSSWPWVRVEAGANGNCSAYSNPRYGVPNDIHGNKVTDAHTQDDHAEGDTCRELLEFNQLYGGGQGVYGQPAHAGVDVQKYYYKVTYINGDKVFAVDYVMNSGEYIINPEEFDKTSIPSRDNYTFAGWVNIAGILAPKIEKGNVKDYEVYASWNEIYTIRFVDWDGNLHHQEEFTNKTTALNHTPNVPDIGGGYTGTWESYDLKNAKGDITVHPIYTDTSAVVKLTPVDEDPVDGVVERYKVSGVNVSNDNVDVVIPSTFNGKPVDEIGKDAFAEFDNIETVKIPTSITYIGVDAFADRERGGGFLGLGLKYEQITFLYEGTYDQWNTIEKDPNWDRYVGDGSKIYFLAEGNYVLKVGKNGDGAYWDYGNRIPGTP